MCGNDISIPANNSVTPMQDLRAKIINNELSLSESTLIQKINL